MGEKAIGEYLGNRIHRAWRLTRHGRERGILDSSLQEPQGTMRDPLRIGNWFGWQVLSSWSQEACKL